MFRKHKHTLLIPRTISRLYYLDDPNGGAGGAGTGGDPAPADPSGGDSFQMPEKFAGKSVEDVAKAYAELEKTLGSRSPSVDYNKIAELMDQKLTTLRPSVPADPTEEENMRQQRELGRKLGFATTEDVNSAKESGRREAMLAITATQLETKYSGKDGEPAFKAPDMVDWLKTAPEYVKQMPLERAFQERYSKEFRDLEIKKAIQGNRAPIVPKGGPKPPPGTPDTSKMTPEQRREHIKAQLEAGAYE